MLLPNNAPAIINQVDGQIVPTGIELQACLNKNSTPSATNPAPGDGPGVLNAVSDAAIAPQTFVPAPRATDGRRVAQFTMVGEGAGYQNHFGWYNVGDSPFTPVSRYEIYACRNDLTGFGCECPCLTGPRHTMPAAGACMTWFNANIVEVDFDCFQRMGRWRGGPVAFYIMTPELITGGVDNNCADLNSTRNRVYSTDNTVNDDGDYVHFLVYRSRTFANGFYFGWEDLFRGGDNDFEDMLVRAIGLVPTCIPTPEVCDGRDNNCNSMIDEGLGTATCGVGACLRTVSVCAMGRPQICVPGVPGAEQCDNVDNDCDGAVDEGLTRPCTAACGAGTQYCIAGTWGGCVSRAVPVPETCDGVDNDCDGMIDEELSRTCSSACGAGIETCRMGAFGGCTAGIPSPEECNGRDDDCDGAVDEGLAERPCRSACGVGVERCLGGVPVCNAPAPREERCNNADDDCNGVVDDLPPGPSCGASSATCRPGRLRCVAGRFVCVGAMGGVGETCNGADDDCDGLIDDGDPGSGGSCRISPAGRRLCIAGTYRCLAGTLRCVGGVEEEPESCNGRDDDCDGLTDEGDALCTGGARCIGGACRPPCQTTEPRCATGQECGPDNLCRPSSKFYGCGNDVCRLDQTCREGRCVDVCEGVRCTGDLACRGGRCVENTCYQFGCPGRQLCLASVCINNPCDGKSCPGGQFCRVGTDGSGRCVPSCADVHCGATQRCRDGACEDDPCAAIRCGAAEACSVVAGAARCVPDPCARVTCGNGRYCVEGGCVDSPCAAVRCPGAPGVVCRNGQCVRGRALPTREELNRPPEGCACRSLSTQRVAGRWGVLSVLVLVTLVPRRRRSVS